MYVKPEGQSVADWLDTWIKDYAPIGRAGSTLKGYQGIIRRYLKPELGQLRLQKLSAEAIQALYTRMQLPKANGGLGLSARTVIQTHAVLHKALSQAVKLDRIAFNPASTERGVELPRPKRHRVEVLSEHKVAALLNAVEGTRLYLPVLLAVTTGMRRGEILALSWDDVDLVRGTLSVVRAWDEGPGRYELKSPKSERSHRTIEMPAILVTALALAKDEHEDCRARRELAGEGYQLEYGPLVFSEEDGEPWWPSRFEWAWQEFRKSSRLAPRFHDLRHTALSLMLRQGNSPKVVQEIAGHHSSAYTMDTYCWSDRRTQRAAADSIGDLFSGALGAVEKQSGNKSGNNSEAVPPLTCDNVVPPREFESLLPP
ncbi:MAG: tyrosine-type recombinase/integrase [Coriobacteriia bacterium]